MKMMIEFVKPDGATVDDVAVFVLDALCSYGGGLHPEDPMFHSLRGKITKMIVHGKDYVIHHGDDHRADRLAAAP
jgi:hypothetical protein